MYYPLAYSLKLRRLLLAVWLLLNGAMTCSYVLAQCTLACNSNVQVSLDHNGQANITVGLIAPYAAQQCPSQLALTVFDPQNNPISPVIHCSRLNQTLPVRITNTASGNVCFGSVIIKDYLPPVGICPDTFIRCNADTSVLAIGKPIFTDNCTAGSALTYSYSDVKIDLPCFTTVAGQTVTAKVERSWIVTDQSGNTATCLEDIWLRRSTIADVTFPNNRDGFGGPFVSCEEDPNNLSLTGQPMIHGAPILNGGDCELFVNKSDQIFNICQPAGYKIFRTWTVSDFCASTFTLHVQLIEVKDFVAPTITPPPSVTLSVSDTACKAVVTLPMPLTSDNCSAVTVTPTWAFGTGFGPFNQVPLGTHTVTYTARDVCNNSASTTAQVTVIDSKIPFAVCKGSILASLPSSGTTLLYPTSLDNGSYDHCSPVILSISRDSVHYAPHDTVKCSDAGKNIRMFLRVQDASLNENVCATNVQVRDQQPPNISCPPNVTLSCIGNPQNLALTGQATATDNCSVQTIVFRDSSLLNNCNIGSILRIWKASDPAGNTKTCTQVINMPAISTLSVSFPADITIHSCATPNQFDTTATGVATWSGNHCGIVYKTYTDEVVSFSPPACFTIFRKWKVYDQCVYNPNSPGAGGYWEKTQKITIFDPRAPVISPPPAITISPDRPDCKAEVNMQPATWTDCSSNVTIYNNSLYATASGANASGLYPPGVHLVVFTATDGCGNTGIASTLVTVKDTKPPTAQCKPGQIFALGAQARVVVPPGAINHGSTDNCTQTNLLQFSLTPDTFNCQTLGAQNVTLRVTDLEGNTGTCQTYVIIQDTSSYCTGKTYAVSGTLTNYKAAKVSEVPVFIHGPSNIWQTFSDAFGKYIETEIPEAANYVVKPRHNERSLNGVNTIDVLKAQRHILGLEPLGTPYQQIAADVNNSRSITSSDIVEMRRLILGAIDTFNKVNSWRFVPSDFVFPNPANPFTTSVPDSILLTNLSAHQLHTNFVAIKMGDVDGTANVADTRSGNVPTPIVLPDVQFAEGENLILPLQIADWDKWDAFQFELLFDTEYLTLDSLVFVQPALSAQHTHYQQDRLAVSWDHALRKPDDGANILVNLHGTARATGVLSSTVRLNPTPRLQPEAYRLRTEDTYPIELFFAPSANTTSGPALRVLEPWPNPFRDEVTFGLITKTGGAASLTISDALGIAMAQQTLHLAPGLNTVTLDSLHDLQPGTYYYNLRLCDAAGSFSGKLMKSGK